VIADAPGPPLFDVDPSEAHLEAEGDKSRPGCWYGDPDADGRIPMLR